MNMPPTSCLTPFRRETLSAVPRPRLEESRVLGCGYGDYPWDDWKAWAASQGVPEALADLGRAVIREAYQHGWSNRLKSLCGWNDNGKRMLRLALRSPETARKRWDRLLATDGYRGEWIDGEWRSR